MSTDIASRALLTLVLLAAWPSLAAAAVTAAVEPRLVDELDTVRLTIRSTGSNQPQRLDLDALEHDFEVLTTQRASQFRSVNGQVESWVEYQIMLRPRHAGDITIPPIDVGGETTEPLTLEVRGLAPEVKSAIDRMVFFETELTRNPVYVQAQTVMIRRLYYSSGAQIYSDLPGMPEIPNAVVMPLGETTSSTTVRDGQRYGVIEQRFAIFPERSGELTVPAIAVTSSVRLTSDGRTRRSGVRVATEPLTVEVLPVPEGYPADQPWLPAEQLTLVDRWSPPDARIEVGDPVRRTLSARVVGNVGSVVPPLEPALPDAHFRSYPEPPLLENDTGGGSVQGSREQQYAIMPTAPGTVNVPPTEVTWWDVNARELRTARTTGRTFTVTGTAVDPAGPDAGTVVAGPSADPATSPDEAPDAQWLPEEEPALPSAAPGHDLWLILAGTLALLVPAVWLLRHWLFAERLPGTGGKQERWRHLKTMCSSGDPQAIHQALLEYLRAHYATTTAESLKAFRADGHGDVLDALNAQRYRPAQSAGVGGDDVLAAVRDVRRRHRPHRDPLPALYD